MIAARNPSLLPTFSGHCRSLPDCTSSGHGDDDLHCEHGRLASSSAVARWNRRGVIDEAIVCDDLCRIRRASKTVITHALWFAAVFAAHFLGLAVCPLTLVRVAILALRRPNAPAPNLWTAAAAISTMPAVALGAHEEHLSAFWTGTLSELLHPRERMRTRQRPPS